MIPMTPSATRRSTDERRVEIAEAALRLIGRRGIADLTIASLATEVGVTSGALFRHFASRDEILDAAFRRVEELIAATFPPQGLPPLERLEKLLLVRTGVVGANAGVARLLFSDQFQLALPASATRRLPALVAQTRTFIIKALTEAVELGEVRKDVAPADLALLVMGAIQATAFSIAISSGASQGQPKTPDAGAQSRRAWSTLATVLAPPATLSRKKRN